MMSFFVIHGYASPDSCTRNGDAVLTLTRCKNEAEVLAVKKEFDEGIHGECSDVSFVVIEGTERTIIPVETVTEYKLQ